jgi:hypothetical protein
MNRVPPAAGEGTDQVDGFGSCRRQVAAAVPHMAGPRAQSGAVCGGLCAYLVEHHAAKAELDHIGARLPLGLRRCSRSQRRATNADSSRPLPPMVRRLPAWQRSATI